MLTAAGKGLAALKDYSLVTTIGTESWPYAGQDGQLQCVIGDPGSLWTIGQPDDLLQIDESDPAFAPTINLLTNPSFNVPAYIGIAKGWTGTGTQQTGVVTTLHSGPPALGVSCQKMAVGGQAITVNPTLSQTIQLPVDEQGNPLTDVPYTLSVALLYDNANWVGNGFATAEINWLNSSGGSLKKADDNPLINANRAGTWVRSSITDYAPPGATQIQVNLIATVQNNQYVNIYFANAQLERDVFYAQVGRPATPFFPNPTFAFNGLNGVADNWIPSYPNGQGVNYSVITDAGYIASNGFTIVPYYGTTQAILLQNGVADTWYLVQQNGIPVNPVLGYTVNLEYTLNTPVINQAIFGIYANYKDKNNAVIGTSPIYYDQYTTDAPFFAAYTGPSSLQAFYRADEPSGMAMYDYGSAASNGTYSATGVTYGIRSYFAQMGGYDTTKAVAFDGIAGYATCGPAANPTGLTTYSVSFWMLLNSTTWTDNPRIIANAHTDSDKTGVQIWLGNVSGAVATLHAAVGIGTNYAEAQYTMGWNTSVWHYIAFTYDGTYPRLYIDNVLQSTGGANAGTIAASASGKPVSLGYNPATAGDYAPVTLADVAFFTTALSPTQITTIYESSNLDQNYGELRTLTLPINLSAASSLPLGTVAIDFLAGFFATYPVAKGSALVFNVAVQQTLPSQVVNSNSIFVQTSGQQFYLNGQEFRFVGFNCYDLVVGYSSTAADQLARLTEMKGYGATVVRTWCFAETTAATPNIGYFQYGATGGLWNEATFVRLDNLLANANAVGMKLILCLANQYTDYGGKGVYVDYYNTANSTALVGDNFHDTAGVEAYFKAFIAKLMARTNTVSGIAYINDPAIFGWECINEGKYQITTDTNPNTLQSSRLATMATWYGTISAYIKSLDPHHLVGTGGISQWYDVISGNPIHNGTQFGVDFYTMGAIGTIDWCDAHWYPANNSPTYTLNMPTALSYHEQLQQYRQYATYANKPLIFGEVGMDKTDPVTAPVIFYPRDQFFTNLFTECFQLGYNGILIWNWSGINGPDTSYGVDPDYTQTNPPVPALNLTDTLLMADFSTWARNVAVIPGIGGVAYPTPYCDLGQPGAAYDPQSGLAYRQKWVWGGYITGQSAGPNGDANTLVNVTARHYGWTNLQEPAILASTLFDTMVLHDKPARYFECNDAAGATATDSSTSAVNGTYTGVTLGATGMIGYDLSNAASFAGTAGSYLDMGSEVGSGWSYITVECIINATSIASGNPRVIACSHTDADNNGYELIVSSTGISFNVGNGTAQQGATYTLTFQTGMIYHIVGVWDGQFVSVYVNGQGATNPNLLTGTISASGFHTYVGRNSAYATTDFFQGAIAKVAIYQDVLPPARIGQHYQAMLAAYASSTGAVPVITKQQIVKVYSPSNVFVDILRDCPLLGASGGPAPQTAVNTVSSQVTVTLPRPFDDFDESGASVGRGTIGAGNFLQFFVYDNGPLVTGRMVWQGYIDEYKPQVDDKNQETVTLTVTPIDAVLGDVQFIGAQLFGTAGNAGTYVDPVTMFNWIFTNTNVVTGNPYPAPLTLDPANPTTSGSVYMAELHNQSLAQWFEAVRTIAPNNWFWTVTPQKTVIFKASSASYRWTFIVGKNIATPQFQRSFMNLKNYIYMKGTAVTATAAGTDIAQYGQRSYVIAEPRIVDQTTANRYAASLLNQYDRVDYRSVLRIVDFRGDLAGLGFDIELLRIGDTCRVINMINTQQLVLWDAASWDIDLHNFSATNPVGATVLVITSITYAFDYVDIEVSSLQPSQNRFLIDLQQQFQEFTMN